MAKVASSKPPTVVGLSAVTLIDGILSVIAFHEKAGRSQVGSFVFSLDKVFLLPSCRCRHPSIRTLRGAIFVSLGASWVFSFQPVLPPACRPLFPSWMEAGPGD